MARNTLSAVVGRWRFTLTLALAGSLVVIVLLALWSRSEDLALTVAAAAQVCLPLSLLVGAALMLARWRFLDEVESAWCAAALLVLGVYLRPELYTPALLQAATSKVVVPDLAMILLIVWVSRCCLHRTAPTGWRHPLVVGLVGGAALSAVRAVWFEFLPTPGWTEIGLILALYTLAAIICVRRFLALEVYPRPHRWQISVPLAVGVGYHHFVPVADGSLSTAMLVATAVGVVTGLCLITTTLALLQSAYADQDRQVATLSDRAARAESRVHREEEVRHEARATVAGISTASHLLMRREEDLSGDQSRLLRSMLASEMIRLQTLLSAPATSDRETEEDVDLDAVVGTLVTSLRAQGARIEYRASHVTVHTCPNALSTAVHVLLCNAQRHAPGAKVSVWTSVTAAHAILHVSDDGPGLPRELEDVLFTRGATADRAPGHGVGLYSAREGMREHGGDLDTQTVTDGAAFTVKIPRAA